MVEEEEEGGECGPLSYIGVEWIARGQASSPCISIHSRPRVQYVAKGGGGILIILISHMFNPMVSAIMTSWQVAVENRFSLI